MVENPEAVTPDELRERRLALGLSQEKFAERLGLSRAAVAQWEGGTRRIPAMLSRALVNLEAEMEAEMLEQQAKEWMDEDGNFLVEWEDTEDESVLQGEDWYEATVSLNRKLRVWEWEASCAGDETLEISEGNDSDNEDTRDNANSRPFIISRAWG